MWDKVGEGTVKSATEFEAEVTEEIGEFFNRETEYKLRTDARGCQLWENPVRAARGFPQEMAAKSQ